MAFNPFHAYTAQTQDSLFPPMPSITLMADNATNFLTGVVRRFDSTQNFTYTPGKLLTRSRERVRARMEGFHNRWLDTKMRLGNRTISLIDRIMNRFDRRTIKNGSESSGDMFGMFRPFLESMRNTIQNMMQNAKDRIPSQLLKGRDAAREAISKGLERENLENQAIGQLNAALKKLDKATRQKYNEI